MSLPSITTPAPEQTPAPDWKQNARASLMEAGKAAEEFRHDFKDFLGQMVDPISWKDGLKLVMEGGFGLLKDLQEMVTQKNWSPDQLINRLDQTFGEIVKKHPELAGEWDKVKVSFDFAKMKSTEALAKFDQSKVNKAVWNGVKGQIKEDLAQLLARFKQGEK